MKLLTSAPMRPFILSLLVATAEAGSRLGHDPQAFQKISPELEPKSDSKFFKKDYPWDKRPVADQHYVFDHPYPAVQDGGDFDRDYVKDENSDGGKWDAQMNYDTLRSKIRRAKKKLEVLQTKMEKEKEDWEAAKKRAGTGASGLSEAEDEVRQARGAADGASQRVNELEGRSQKDGTQVGGEIGKQVKHVQKEMKDLEDCKKKLAEAKKKLKDLVQQKTEYEHTQEEIRKQREKEEKEKMERQRKREEEAKKRKEARKKAGEDVDDDDDDDDDAPKEPGVIYDNGGKPGNKFDEDAWQARLDKETKRHQKVVDKYEEEYRELKVTEDQLARAAETLKKYRRSPHVDDDGGVYNVPNHKSNSVSASAAAAVAMVAFFVIS